MKRTEDNSTSQKKKVLKWDEETIAEHDKERGTRQKILEAPTPYRYSMESDVSEAEADEPDWDSIEKKLNQEIKLRDLHGIQRNDIYHEQEGTCLETPPKKESEDFKAKRASHYNEFLTLKLLREKNKLLDSDEEDGEEEEEDKQRFNLNKDNEEDEDDDNESNTDRNSVSLNINEESEDEKKKDSMNLDE